MAVNKESKSAPTGMALCWNIPPPAILNMALSMDRIRNLQSAET
jgi:hypothetical protein